MIENSLNIQGQLHRKCMWPPLRILLTVTGISLLIGLVSLAGRYLLQLRANATVVLTQGMLTTQVTYTLWGKVFKTVRTITPNTKIQSVQLENRFRIIHLIAGFGSLVIGVFCGVHWLLDGLGAGYPSLFLVGAGVVVGSIAIDVILNYLIPEGEGRNSVVINTAGWRFRLTGLSKLSASRFVDAMRGQLAPLVTNDYFDANQQMVQQQMVQQQMVQQQVANQPIAQHQTAQQQMAQHQKHQTTNGQFTKDQVVPPPIPHPLVPRPQMANPQVPRAQVPRPQVPRPQMTNQPVTSQQPVNKQVANGQLANE